MSELQLEINKDFAEANNIVNLGFARLELTPPLNEDYWLFRVKLHKDQAIVGFPKFGTIGIGFAQETDWNTNLPYTQNAEAILMHIAHNRKYDEISSEDCLEAIRMIQEAAKALQKRE